jgi:phage terminase large subunit
MATESKQQQSSRFSIDPDYRYPSGISPTEFCIFVLGLTGIYDWQIKCMEAVAQGHPTALLAANGSGKSRRVIVPLLLWFLFSFPRGVAKVTSASWQQLHDQICVGLEEFRPKLVGLGWNWLQGRIESPQGGFISVFSTDNPGRAEGFHGSPTAPLMYIIDEAKSVSDDIFEASDRCTAQYRLAASSPAGAGGRLYDCFNRLAAFYYGIRVTSYDCPHITEEIRQRDLAMWGEADPWYRSRHLAEFADDETIPRIVNPQWIRACWAEPPAYQKGSLKAFCDFAAGGAENVIAVADGNRVFIGAAWRETDTVQAARQFRREFERLGLNQGQVWGDDGGLGHVMIDQIAELGFYVTRVNNELPAADPDHFANLGSEIWFQAARRIEKREVILPDDRTFFEQATGRRRDYDAKGRLIAEQKKKMSARGLESPDRADAIFGALYSPSGGAITAEMLRGITLGASPFGVREEFSFETSYEPD